MPCYHPLRGYRAPGGQIKFARQGAFQDQPMTVSCGQCTGCRLERSRQWAIRINHEAQMHEQNSFVTLTYSDKHLPKDGALDVTHWQKFAKRLRKKNKFRFYHVGEYGKQTNRAHLHACIFGLDWSNDRELYTTTREGHPLYTSPSLDQMWGLGRCWIGELTFESAAYVARYILEKHGGKLGAEKYGVRTNPETGQMHYKRKREYATMSRNPGIGKTWLDRYLSDVYPSDQVISKGRACQPPAFYDTQLEKINPELLHKIKRQRRIAASKHQEDQTPERLAVAEEVQEARTSFLIRD